MELYKWYAERLVLIGLMVIFLVGCTSAGMLGNAYASDDGIIVDIDARLSTPDTPVSFELEPGIYQVTVIGTDGGGVYDGWKIWYWPGGWVNKYCYRTREFETVIISDDIIYDSPVDALANALGSSFVLTKSGPIDFFIADSPTMDNSGGMSVKVSLVGEP